MNRITQADREHKEKWGKRTVPKCKKLLAVFLCLVLTICLIPTTVAFAIVTENVDVYGGEVLLVPPEGKIKSCESVALPEGYGEADYPYAICMDVTLTDVEDNASFTIDILSNARKGKNNTLNNYICEVGFTYAQRDALIADTSAFSAKYAEITASESSLYSGSNKTYNIPVQLENGVKQIILYYYTYTQKSALLTPSSFVPPIVFILNFQKEVTTLTEDIDVYGSTIWLIPPEGKVKSCEEAEVPEQYGEDYYKAAASLNITLTGVDANASITVDLRSDARDVSGNKKSNVISAKGCTFEEMEELEESIDLQSQFCNEVLASESALYSSSKSAYQIPVQLVEGAAQVSVFYYDCDLGAVLSGTGVFAPPVALVLNFQKDGAGSVTPPSGPTEVLTENVLTKLVPEFGQLENENALYGTVGKKTRLISSCLKEKARSMLLWRSSEMISRSMSTVLHRNPSLQITRSKSR